MKLLSCCREPDAPAEVERRMREVLDDLRENPETPFFYRECGGRLTIAVRHDDGQVFAWSARIDAQAVATESPRRAR